MSLWQCVLVIPTSIAICEQGFSKQNWVKSGRRTRLNLETLDALMRAFLNGLEVDAMNWNAIYNIWKVDTTSQTSKSSEKNRFPYVFHQLVILKYKFRSICFAKFVRQI
jgi:hypothetical protein